MTRKIYSTGYTGKNINELKPLLEVLDAFLVDVRFAPTSQIMHWRQVYLKVLLGKKYLHIVNLGNRRYREEGKIEIQNLKLGIQTLLSLERNAVLFCACEQRENCHRRFIIEELEKLGHEVTEIKNWKTFHDSLPKLPFLF